MFLFAIVGALFTSCSSNDDENEGASGNELVGYWLRYEDNDQYMEEYGFFADGTCNYTESYEPDDDSDNLEPEYEFEEGTYTVKGNKLIMTFGDETETWTYTFKSVKSKKQLILRDDEGDTYTYDYYKK